MPATEAITQRDQYLERVQSLFDSCTEWAAGAEQRTRFRQESVVVREEPVESYSAPVLVIERPGREAVRLTPKGRWVVGAEGRVDMESPAGVEYLLYLPAGPRLTFRDVTDTGLVLSGQKEEAAEGWHYAQSRHLRYYPLLDRELFLRLLELLGT